MSATAIFLLAKLACGTWYPIVVYSCVITAYGCLLGSIVHNVSLYLSWQFVGESRDLICVASVLSFFGLLPLLPGALFAPRQLHSHTCQPAIPASTRLSDL